MVKMLQVVRRFLRDRPHHHRHHIRQSQSAAHPRSVNQGKRVAAERLVLTTPALWALPGATSHGD